MMCRMRRHSRTICLSLAFITISLHLLLALVSLSVYHQPCDSKLPPRTHVLRELALTNYTSVGISGLVQPPSDTTQRDPSNKEASKDAKGCVQTVPASINMGANVGHYSANRAEFLKSGLSKLEALFSHPLYNIHSPPIPEEDWLLKVKPKVKTSEKHSLMWVSASYEDIHWNSGSDSHPPWLRFHLGISRWQLYPHCDPNMEALTQQLATHRIISAVQKSGGTQLKLVMSFSNYGQAMVKPMRQEREDETNYNLYYFSDFERHNAEIAAFHLDRILGYRRIPPVVGRLVDVVKEIKDVTTDHKLARTFFTSPVGNVCFYGQCSYYCSTEHAVCGRPKDLEASVAVMLPDLSLVARRTWRSPWRRSYSRSKLAKLVGDGSKLLFDGEKDAAIQQRHQTGGLHRYGYTRLPDEPYDLMVVRSSEAGSEHYIFSPSSVLHVTESGYGGLVSLAEWYRESALWRVLQDFSFFRDFRLRKAFTWWQRNVRKILFQRRCEDLQDLLLIAVPQFRSALHLFTRLIEELKETHQLPQRESKTYTLLEFKNVLITKYQDRLQILEKLSQYRTVILNMVKENSYKAHEELQLHMEYAKKPNKRNEPIHLHLAHQQELKKELELSETILHKLGNFASLVNQMVVQSLITIVRQDVLSFLNVLKRKKSQQCCLFNTELCFSANSQLTVEPPIHLFQDAISEAVLTIGHSIIQMCDICGFFREISNTVLSSEFAEGLTFDLSSIDHPIITGEDKTSDGITGRRKFCCWQLLRDLSADWLVLPKRTPLLVQGCIVHGCYYPLSKTQLEWQISMNDIAKVADKDQTISMQKAEVENQQLCENYSWLVDIHLFICQWSQASLEAMKGQSVLLYEEHIKKLRHWADRINTVPSSISTSNQLFNIHCAKTKETLEGKLRVIEEEVLEQLVEQIKQHSESLISYLERTTAELKTEPQDLHDLSNYSLTLRESVKMFEDTQKQLDYIHSLQNIVCINYRTMTEQELALEEKMMDLWDCFIPLLKQANSVVCAQLPSEAKALDSMVSFLMYDLKNTVSKAISGPFVDPTQNAKEMASRLKHTYLHVHNLREKLEQLSRKKENLQEHTLDLSILTTDIQKVKARKELWELVAVYTAWMEEWKQLIFSEVVVSQAQGKIAEWKEQVLILTSIIPTNDAVLQETLGFLESINHQIAVMAKLQSSTLKHKHWRAMFEGMGLLYVPEKQVTVAELMSQQLEVHQNLITKICRDAQAECNMEQTFQKLRQGWEDRFLWLDKFTVPVWQYCELHCGLADTEKQVEGTVSNVQPASQHTCNDERFTVIGLDIHFAEIENDLMTLTTMLKSPYSTKVRLQMEDWVQSLQDLEQLLTLFERYQQIWAFLMKMFNETLFGAERVDLLKQFQPVDETFREIMHSISTDPHVLNLVSFKRSNDKFSGNGLYQILTDGLSTMDAVSNQMLDLLDPLCEQFPRLWFLSDREIMQLLSFHPTPFMLHSFVCKCFKGVHWLEVDNEIQSNLEEETGHLAKSESYRRMKVLGIFGRLHEHITFLSPVEPNPNPLVWLCVFEKQLKLSMVKLMNQCATVRNQLEPSSYDLAGDKDTLSNIASRSKKLQPVLDLLSEYPLQCLLVAEEAVWSNVVLQAFQEISPVKLSSIKAYISEKLRNLGRSIRNRGTGTRNESLVSKYMMMCLRALVQLTMNHAQQLSQLMEVRGVLESSFEWLSLMKYHITSEDQTLTANDTSACYVDVLGYRLQYGYEYFGPEDWLVHTPSTNQAILGILLALTSYRCGFVNGPYMSGKKKTVVQLGKALGRQVVIVQCCPSMRPGVVQKMLLGALQTGALLLLDSVDLLTEGVLSSLGQHLVEIQQSLCELASNKNQSVNDKTQDSIVDGITGTNSADPECHVVIAGKSIPANLNYGCVLISSKGFASEVPESLRFATRSVALTNPDYRIIAEVMLTSIGFSEGSSLSRRLVSLITLAKDSLCLPDFFTSHHSCFLVVLQKIISSSEIHLQQSVRQQEDEVKELAAEQTDHMSSQIVPAEVVEKDWKENEKPFRLNSSHLTVIRGLVEEIAIVKAILSVLLPFLYDHKKASQFYMIFKDAFPIACQFPLFQQYMEEEEKKQLKAAITEELQRKWLHADSEIISAALTLFQTMKFSQAVLLIGPSGSGKTSCYCALAGALNSLAIVEYIFENDYMIKADASQGDPQISALNRNFVDTLVVFPNAMSHEEVFGCFCEKRGWKDGAVTRFLRDSEQQKCTGSKLCDNKKKSDWTPIVKWLVMDGEPVGQPGWLDCLSTLCDSHDPFLFLSTGEIFVPSQLHFKLLLEITDLSDASPSAVTRCSLVHFTGTDLWKAVWKSEMDALHCKHSLDQGTLKMWNHLAEDLFSRTLSLVRQKGLTSAVHSKGRYSKSPVNGLQEIMSFVRILCALLQHFEKEVGRPEPEQIQNKDIPLRGTDTPLSDAQCKQELLSRNLFVVAYIWGFGGHLHPSTDSKMFPKNTLLTNSITPKYGKHLYLLNLMLEANQPVLLGGEPGSGKTTLCQTLLSFDKPHISLPASPLLSPRDVHTVLKNISCQKHRKYNVDSLTKQQKLLLFVDDLHEAPCDVSGKASMALELLRQSISKGEILTFDTYRFKLLNSAAVGYMATCCVSGLSNNDSNVISSRLSRLFSIFVLPSLSIDVILSIHSPRLQSWLKEIPFKQSVEDIAGCIINATKDLYQEVCEQFLPTVQRPHFMFSHCDLQKVFQGMYLWQPNIPNNAGTMQKEDYALPGCPPVMQTSTASVVKVVHLWMHECMRTFSDRLCSDDESKILVSLIAKVATTHYGSKLVKSYPDSTEVSPTVINLAIPTLPRESAGIFKQIGPDTLSVSQEPNVAGHSEIKKDYTSTEPSFLSENSCSEEASLKKHHLHKTLQHMEDIMPQLLYGPEISEVLNSVNLQSNFKCSYTEQDLDTLQQKLSGLMDRSENDKGHDNYSYNFTSSCIVHRQRMNQLLHILRALLIPGGHGVLIGSDRGTGRKTTVRLAAYFTGYQLMEVHCGNETKLHEILKEAGNRTRVDEGKVIILVHEEIKQSIREELLVAMAHRTYPALYTEEELRNLVSRVTAVKNSRRYLMDSWMFEKYLSHIHRNVHVFLLMSLTMSGTIQIPANSGTHSWKKQMTKALSCSCCVEVYQPWSSQSLVEAALKWLKSSPYKMNREVSEASLSVAMAGVHHSACQYASVLLRAQPFTPQTYMEFISHFGYICKHLHKQWKDRANRIASILSHLDIISITAVQHKQHLKILQDKVAETRQREKELLRAVDDQKRLLQEAQQKCLVKEVKLFHLEKQINQAQELERYMFLAALKTLKCLNPSDLEEVRHYRDPPERVVKIMDAICLLFNSPPGWESAKQLLGQSNFFQELEFFDRNSLTNEQLQQLGQIVNSAQFVPESVREVSQACESLCRWVQAIYECCCMQNKLLIKQHLEVVAEEARGQLHLARQDKEDACRRLEDVMLQLQFVQKDLEEQLLKLHKAEIMEGRAATAASHLRTHVRDWKASAQDAELQNQNLSGDSLILAAVIAYLGPFAPDVRRELLKKWRELCKTGSININPKDPRASLFKHSDTAPPHLPHGFPIPVSERLQLPLAQALGMNERHLQDKVSPRLLIKLLLWGYRSAWVQRWPLLADTQQHLEITSQKWLMTGENANLETECGMVICASDPELLDKLDQAAEKGFRVLVTHVERVIPSPHFLARLARPAGCCHLGLKHVQPTHPGFCLLLSTHLPVTLLYNKIHPSILAQVHVVDLSLSSEEIQELMLTQLLQSECKNLLIHHLQFQNDKQLLQEKLATEEDALLDYILQSDPSLLHDSEFLPRMAASQEAMKKLQDEIQQLSKELEFHEALVAAPRQLMRLAAALYQVLQDVSRLSSAYYFSLRAFITVMQQAFIVRSGRLVSHSNGKVLEGMVPEITNRMVAKLLAHYRPCLFKSHVAVLKLLVSTALLQHNQLCSEGERVAFLRGLQHTRTSSQSLSSRPTWIPPHIYSELLLLEKIPSFRGLIASLSTSPKQWQEYLQFPSSTVVGDVPCRSHAHLTLLQRALLWKTMLPNCLEGLAEDLATCNFCLPGQMAGSEVPHNGNPEALSQYLVKHEGPIILAHPSPSGDKWTSIQPLYLINKLAHCVAQTKKVQVKVISLGALYDRDLILSALDKAVKDGHWLVFNNCHLLEHWDDKVVAHLSHSGSSDERRLVHPCFRLWFITQEHTSHSLPAALRMCALPLVCDSPLDLKEELSCSLREVVSLIQCQSLLDVTADNVELLVRCAIFHSVLLQRQTYKYLGQGRIYNWSQDDLLALVDAHNCIVSLCHDKTKALQYIAVNLVHGGHVLDSADLEVVEGVANTCLSRASPLWGSGPHILLNIINKPGHLDLSELLEISQHGLQDSPTTNDSLVLGFNVAVAAEMVKINSHNLNKLLQASQAPLGIVRSVYTQLNQPTMMPAYNCARDRLQALKSDLANKNDNTVINAGVASHSPIRDFLQAEWRDLIDLVSLLLSQLQQPVQYSSPTFASLLKLRDLSHLERRAELLSAYLWHHNTSDPAGAYRLSAFKNARGFLVAMIREATQVNRKFISDIELHFQVLSDSTYPAVLPLGAVYLCGLELRGASWDTQLAALQDTVLQQSCSMPLVSVKAQVRSRNTARDTFPCRSSYLTDISNVKVSDAVSTAPQLPVYHCPLYLDEKREMGDWGLADVNIITKVPLHARLNPVLCSLRRVRLVSML
ncbi:dynein heavy chain domain-containing protein 1 isoform X2 [Mastacembelus armatus]|uniref:dynein heavy chain domain-containing protein 1 isoform X2 n=1 Tax=Mastacembelus armatus TaxID=205130 RepID=UPI000E464C6F|nr:dynein heavy chain domain-containing protein 1-like isoform X2 [Mastacembelus armatus]